MPDNTTIRGPADRKRINLKQEHELAYWTKALKVNRSQLRAAVTLVGPMAADVRKLLKARPKRKARKR